MSDLIKGMKMPFTCLTCDFHKCAGGVGDFCSLTKRKQFRFKNRPKDCPIIEVPEPHGRLGDLDALQKQIDIARNYGMIGKTAHYKLQKMIKEAPTIIQADPEEKEMK